jgi:Carboxypeptidase regulatory-like domain
MNRSSALSLALMALAGAACRPGQPLVNTDPARNTTPGTIAGAVRTVTGEPLAERRVEAVDTKTGQRYAALTGVTGGFSIKVPPAHYRLELELQQNETIVRDPGVIDINSSDLDPDRDIVVGPR